jgi:hypothetical protein
VVIEGLDYVLVELPNFLPETWTYAHKQLAVLWLRFLNEIDGYIEKIPKELNSNKLIRSAIQICKESALTPEELEAYERAREQMIWDNSIKGLEDEVVESRKTIKEKDKTIEEKDKTIEEKDIALKEERKARAKLEAELEKLKKNDGVINQK